MLFYVGSNIVNWQLLNILEQTTEVARLLPNEQVPEDVSLRNF